ncbi:acyl-CoA carboxylase subunit epsilon [Desertihabitans aurantiacus]|uniref:acyl-CoA carboxylase subunit epsilon n=1 Tax=Desertihabitans aurantiacus TaxID=2282477 RepID=UPI000DF76DA7|nr:acyl-CoA carboxylase subunit epsilon [Desertihabitans aurantiacus]
MTDSPVLQVVSGDPTPEELAALVVVLQSRSGAAEPPQPPPSGWSAHWRRTRPPLLAPRPGAWQASGWQ